jgi:hypothetical protein
MHQIILNVGALVPLTRDNISFMDNWVSIGFMFLNLVKQKRVPTQGGNESFCPHEVDSLLFTRDGML